MWKRADKAGERGREKKKGDADGNRRVYKRPSLVKCKGRTGRAAGRYERKTYEPRGSEYRRRAADGLMIQSMGGGGELEVRNTCRSIAQCNIILDPTRCASAFVGSIQSGAGSYSARGQAARPDGHPDAACVLQSSSPGR